MILFSHNDKLEFDSQYLSYFNELGLYFKKIEDRFPIDKL